MARNDTLETKSAYCDALVINTRKALYAPVGWFPLWRLKRQRAKVEKELKRIEGKP
ncbi:hypothetical protein GO755_29685 [Spirosoma sp. HMF4905]|uniref:Uncharacterized protein n=1 Tax=Spirosoma arboris TaxID=2682092 RepID=A0A7K1SKA4_9BACT|nr:hypothetical protein [Spirosoma arboris]MVM34239.1 hypothetical protein [Spirosoma arboris]